MSGRTTTPSTRLGRLLLSWVLLLATEGVSTHGDDAATFRDRCAALAAEGDSLAVSGIDGWAFLRAELRHLGVGPFWGADAAKVSRAKPAQADPLPAIVDFHEQLAARGITLVLMPVPCKAAIYPEKLGQPVAAGRVDAAARQFYEALAAKGVGVLDLADGFLAAKADDASAGPVFCRTDTHWSPRGCEIAAAAVANRIKDLAGTAGWLAGPPGGFSAATEDRSIAGDLAAGGDPEVLPARVVTRAAGSTEDKASPVLLLGDSHVLVYHAGGELHGTSAGLADQLASELGIPVDVIGVRGSGATPARINLLRRAKPDPAYLAGKKVVVWCFAAREFTESSGWAVVPLPAAGQ